MPTLTVTGAFTGAGAPPAAGLIVAVDVLNGALPVAQQTGLATFAAEEATHTPQGPITPNFSGSMIAACADWAPNTAVGSIAGGTTVISTFTTATIGAAAFRNTAGTTAGTPVTVGGNTPSTTNGELSIVEIRAATTITVDGSSPTPVTSATAQSLQTASFSPPVGSLLVAYVTGYDGGVGTVGASVTDSLGLVWTQVVTRGTAGQGIAAIFIADVPSTASATTASPGKTWLRRFQHKQQSFQIAPTATPVTISGIVSTVSVDAPIGGIAPAVTSPVMLDPGPSWTRVFKHRQIAFPQSNTVLFGTTAAIAVSSQFADETATVSSAGTTSAVTVAITGETLLTSVPGVVANIAVSSAAGTISETDTGAVASVNVAVPAQSILETISGAVSSVSVDAPAGIVLYTSTVGQQAQPGTTWKRFFHHRQTLQTPAIPGTAVNGIIAQINVAALPGSISTGAGGTVSTVSVSSTGTVSVSLSSTAAVSVASSGSVSEAITGATGSVTVAGISGSVPRTLAGTTATISVTGIPGSIITGSGLLGVTANITVASAAGTLSRIISGSPAVTTVASAVHVSVTLNGVVSTSSVAGIAGSVRISQAGKTSGITVTATPGLTGQVVITGEEWTPLIWKGSLVITSSGRGVPLQWGGSVIAE